MPYSDATRQVLDLAVERLGTDPTFSPDVVKALRQLIEKGTFQDVERILAAVDKKPSPADGDCGDAD